MLILGRSGLIPSPYPLGVRGVFWFAMQAERGLSHFRRKLVFQIMAKQRTLITKQPIFDNPHLIIELSLLYKEGTPL